MTALADTGAGVLLALSFALLWQRRLSGMLLVLALQCAVTAAIAAWQAAWAIAVPELLWGVAGLPWLLSRSAPNPTGPEPAMSMLLAGAALVAVCLPLGVSGPGLAIALLACLVIALRPLAPVTVVGLASLQTGIVAAGLAAGGGLSLLAAPCLPALGLLLCNRLPIWTGRRSGPSASVLRQADWGVCALLCLGTCALPVLGTSVPGPWQMDAPGLLAAILASLAVCLLHWPPLSARFERVGSVIILGACIAVLTHPPVLSWAGLAVATLAACRRRQLPLAAIGLGLTLFGSTALLLTPLPACAVLLVGLACLAALAPELAIVSLAFLLRLRGQAGLAGALDPILVAAGLTGLLTAAVALALRPRRLPELATLGQAGVALYALGLDTPQARLAAVLQIVLLVLTRSALEVSQDGLPRMAALAGLAGLPPLGLFPSLALVLAATSAQQPLLFVPLAVGLAGLGWLVLRRIPVERRGLSRSLAWLPLAAGLLIGLAMPGPIGDGLRLVAGQLP